MNNTGIIVSLANVRKHPNADRLVLATVLGTTIVVGSDAKDGDVGAYFDSNVALSAIFLKANNLYRDKTKNSDVEKTGYFDDLGRVKCIKLRGELSDGFFCGFDSLMRAAPGWAPNSITVGQEVNSINGVEICKKYVPVTRNTGGGNTQGKKGRKIAVSPMFVEHFDTEQYMRNRHKLMPGIIYLEEKLHGTSHRTANVIIDVEHTRAEKLLIRMLSLMRLRLFAKVKDGAKVQEWKYMNGMRRVTLDSDKDQNHYHDNTMRDEVLDHLRGKLMKGEEVYMELVGYEKTGAQIQKGFPYGCHENQYKVLLYRVSMNNADGKVIDMHREAVYRRADELGLLKPTLFEKYYYDGSAESLEELTARIVAHAQGQSTWDAKTLKEGVVVWYVNESGGWSALKYKSDAFRLGESKGKDEGIIDQEDVN